MLDGFRHSCIQESSNMITNLLSISQLFFPLCCPYSVVNSEQRHPETLG